jgi:hypothetical protein
MKRTPDLDSRIRWFFLAVVSRNPRPNELKILKNLYETEVQAFVKEPLRAESLLSTGEYPRDKTLNTTELAAFTVVANTILNYDEAVVKR